jgi:hypothetical protein
MLFPLVVTHAASLIVTPSATLRTSSEGSERSGAMGSEMLRCAQHDSSGLPAASPPDGDKSAPTEAKRLFNNLHRMLSLPALHP